MGSAASAYLLQGGARSSPDLSAPPMPRGPVCTEISPGSTQSYKHPIQAVSGDKSMEETLEQSAATLRELLETADRLGMRETEPLNRLMSKMARFTGMYPVPNVAVEICYSAYLRTLQEHREQKM